MTDEGVEQARQQFVERGREDMLKSDKSWYRHSFGLRDAVQELGDVARKGDWSTSFLGGYQVEVVNLSDREDNTFVEFRVHNTTGWGSATRVWRFSFKVDEIRSEPGPGGNLDQGYIWQEMIPK